MRIYVDASEVRALARDLEPSDRLPEFRKVVSRGALNIKNGLRDDAKSNGSYRHFYRSISYDMVGDLEAEIGPDKNKVQGALGNILYFGTSKNAPELNIMGPLDREEPRFVQALGDVAEDLL